MDDLVLVPLGIALAIKMIPPEVLDECRAKAQSVMREGKPTNWVAGAIIVTIWVLLASLMILLPSRALMGE